MLEMSTCIGSEILTENQESLVSTFPLVVRTTGYRTSHFLNNLTFKTSTFSVVKKSIWHETNDLASQFVSVIFIPSVGITISYKYSCACVVLNWLKLIITRFNGRKFTRPIINLAMGHLCYQKIFLRRSVEYQNIRMTLVVRILKINHIFPSMVIFSLSAWKYKNICHLKSK